MTMLMNEAAYPSPAGDHRAEQLGLSKRELFAAMAMQGILSRSNTNWARMEVQLAEQSVRHADALIKELSK